MYYFAQTQKQSPEKVGKDEERELLSNIAALQNMFPTVDRGMIVSALAMCDNNIDRATDQLIAKGKMEGIFY